MNSVIVDTPCGKVEGELFDGVRKFLGIRFAEAGRWEYPKEIKHWDGLYKAKNFGAGPIQEDTFTNFESLDNEPFYYKEFLKGGNRNYSEDCLNLNIWTPDKPKNCPILVAIYGGGLTSGQADQKVFDGAEYAKRGIILVTFNYRVNIFGLFASIELDKEVGKSGNYALYDQLTAFQWIRHNIKAFGGNIEKMTLIGQSAGASSVETQIKSKINRGLFQGAIIQSSAGFVTGLPSFIKPKKKNVYKAWDEIYQKSGCKSFSDFRKLPTERLYTLWRENNKGFDYTTTFPDDVFKPEDAKEPCPVNILCGITSEDTAPAIFYWITKRFAKRQEGCTPVYAYMFNRQLPGDEFGAWHASDLWYTYGTLERSWRPFTDEDRKLSDIMIDYFADFIKTGNPNTSSRAEWPPLNGKQKSFMNFDVNVCKMVRPKVGKLIKTTLTYKGPRT